jgi:uncharacterized protein (TIGR00369 family)
VTATAADSYPPEVHVLRDLALKVQHAPGVSRAWMALNEHMGNDAGHVRAGVLTVLVDAISGGLAASTAAPDWIATADLTLHVTRPVDVSGAGELEAVAQVARAGRTTVVLETAVSSAGAPMAISTLTFGVLPRREGNPVMTVRADVHEGGADDDDPARRPRETFLGAAGGFTQNAYESIGFVDRGGGNVELPTSDYIVNSIGGVQGGVLGALVDAAAGSALGPEFELVDLHLVYLALARIGPIVTSTEVWTDGGDHATVSVDVHDLGAGRRTTVATGSAVRWRAP